MKPEGSFEFYLLMHNVSVNSKPDHPPGKPQGNFCERENSPHPGHKESAKPRPQGKKNRAHPRGNYFQKSSQRKHKTRNRSYEKQYRNADMFRNIKIVKHIEAQSF